MAFQKQVSYTWAPAVEGDFASTNPRASAMSIDGLRAGDDGVTIGVFAWVKDDGVTVVNQQTAKDIKPTGFVRRGINTAIVGYMQNATMTYQPGMPLSLQTMGDYWARSKNGGTRGQKIFVSTKDGSVLCDEAGVSKTDYIETDWYCALTANANELVIISSTAVY
ncbi:unnamed protein product [Commensalibacter communis]|uniref:Uncharacterized protein n=1 Tax=Commensalibacter communis TaxID=2972786 RepID=A0A9W4TQQ0_9PROT|nr:hypothetical protein [Commensalibacter communis]CAI3941887.1 unnamed protein product [Commensalibacter communis]CAI3944750.1 unnamed protein product [Commensalibacter communis]CAI3958956.1 unnamed protein product [Commensalibacter communis]CAI3961082.1 unnamed protein product [Commensalibacter communis]